MSARTCPKCKTDLGKNSFYFCSNCGAELSGHLIQPPSIVKITHYTPEPSVVQKYSHELFMKIKYLWSLRHVKKAIFLSSAAVFILVALGVYFKVTGRFDGISDLPTIVSLPNPNANVTPVVVPTIQKVVEVSLPVSEQMLNSGELLSFVPKDAAVYVEGHNYPAILAHYFNSQDVYKKILSGTSLLMEPQFVAFATENGNSLQWTGIFVPKNVELASQIAEDLTEYGVYFEAINGKIVLSTDREVFEKVKAAADKTEQNLGLTPEFALAKNTLPREGQMQILFFSEEGKTFLRDTAQKTKSASFIKDVELIISSGYNELVIGKY
jgi:hypothetical protein